MFCKKCGKEIDDDSEFCVHCGATVSVTVLKDGNGGEDSDGDGKKPAVSSDKYPMALPKGSVLAGQYIIDKPIGQGGFGITYIAEDHNDGKKVAVKEYYPETLATRKDHTQVIPLNTNRNENYRYGMDCFLQEAKTLSNFIDNEDIVRVYSYFEENNTAYFVMEYIEGVSLADYIRGKGGKVSFDDACHTLFPIMDALAAVHEKGIIHRDISPDNIFVTWEGHVKLIDFGAARYSIGDRSMSLDVILKHGFAPKEQYSRHGRQGPYTDIYALAATFYFAITGKRPQDSVDRMDNDLLIHPSAAGAGIGPNAEKALLHALEVQPDKRYQKMTDFKQAMVEAIKLDNSPDAVQENVIPDDEKTFLGEGFAPQGMGMTGNGVYTQQSVGVSMGYPQNAPSGMNGGYPQNNIGMTVNEGYPQQTVMGANTGYPQQTVMGANTGYPQQTVMGANAGFPQQNAAMGGNAQGYPQQIPVTQMNTGIPNTGIPNTSWVDPSAPVQSGNKKGKLPLILIIAAAVTVVLLVVVGVILLKGGSSGDDPGDDPIASNQGGNEDPTPTKEKKPTPTDAPEEDPTPTEAGTMPGPAGVPEIDMAGHLLEGSSSTYYYCVVTNKSLVPVALKGNAVAYDASGNMLGVDDDTVSILGAGETSILNFYFSGITGIDHVDCQPLPSTDISYYPFIGNIRLDQSVNEENVVVTATNNGDARALFMEVYALFFDADGNLVDAGSHYMVDGEGQLASGDSRSVEIESSEAFDHVECYLTGYSDGEPRAEGNSVSDKDFTIKEYSGPGNYGGTRYFLTITSNCDTPVQMNVNMTAYDASGKAVGAGDSQIEILAKGETSIASFSFSSDAVDHVEYTLGCGTRVIYDPIIGKLDVKGTKANGKAIVSVKNNGSVPAEFARVYVLFFDAKGNVVYADDDYITDDDYQIKPGVELSEEIKCRVEYDHVECYVVARAKKSSD